jgi:streptogramin lyase
VLPIRDAVPYIARVHPRTGAVWIGTAAADAVVRFDPATRRFTAFRLPTRGATVRHLSFDPATGDVWLAYGASPALHPARIARLRTQ